MHDRHHLTTRFLRSIILCVAAACLGQALRCAADTNDGSEESSISISAAHEVDPGETGCTDCETTMETAEPPAHTNAPKDGPMSFTVTAAGADMSDANSGGNVQVSVLVNGMPPPGGNPILDFEVPQGGEQSETKDFSLCWVNKGDSIDLSLSASRCVGATASLSGSGDGGSGEDGGCTGGKCLTTGRGQHSDALGEGTVTLGCVDVNVFMGRASFTKSAGTIHLLKSQIDSTILSPASLSYISSVPDVDVIRTTPGVLRQIKAPEGLMDVASDTGRLEMRFYAPGAFVNDASGGTYPITGSPFVTWRFEKPEGGDGLQHFRVKKTQGLYQKTYDYTWDATKDEWNLEDDEGPVEYQSRTVATDGLGNSWAIYTNAVPDGIGGFLRNKRRIYAILPKCGERLVEQVDGVGGPNARTNRWTYKTDVSTNHVNYGKTTSFRRYDGYWEVYQYDVATGSRTNTKSQYLDAEFDADPLLCRVVSDDPDTPHHSLLSQRTRVEKIMSIEVSRSITQVAFSTGAGRTVTDFQCAVADGHSSSPGNLVTVYEYNENDRLSAMYSTHGTTTYSYVSDATTLTTTEISTPINSPATRTVTIIGVDGSFISEHRYDDQSNILLSSKVVTSTDDLGRALEITYEDGSTETFVYGCDCGGLSEMKDRTGIKTFYTYNELGGIAQQTRAGITETNAYDGAGALIRVERIAGGQKMLVSRFMYDLAGRMTGRVDALNHTNFFREEVTSAGLVNTTINPDDSTRVETRHPDGRLLSIGGTAVRPQVFEYGVANNRQFTKTILVGDGGATTEWSKRWSNMLGQNDLVEYADQTQESSVYAEDTGELERMVSRWGIVRNYTHNPVERTWFGDSTTATLGSDRVADETRTFVEAHGTWVTRVTRSVWMTENAAQEMSIEDTTADGRDTWTWQWPMAANSWSYRSVRTPGNGTQIVTNMAPSGQYRVEKYSNGLLRAVTDYDSTGDQVSGMTFAYDVFGRRTSMTDLRNGTTTLLYDPLDRLVSTTTPVPFPGAAAQTTSNRYDSMSRITNIVLADGGVVTNEYYPTGELKKKTGARTYPVAYAYDTQGRMKTMTTWQDYANDAGTATTTWNYDPQNGMLVGKVYPHPDTGGSGGTGPTYTYGANGTVTRTWARGIATTTTKDRFGSTETVTYSDGTPGRLYIYDQLGRALLVMRDTVQSYGGTIPWGDLEQLFVDNKTYGFDANGNVYIFDWDTSDQYTATALMQYTYDPSGLSVAERSFQNGASVTRTLDDFGRLAQISMPGGVYEANYAYDNAGRLETVTSDGNEFTYGYVPNSRLLERTTFEGPSGQVMDTARSYDNLNRLIGITNATPSFLKSFTYGYNDANMRTNCVWEDGSQWAWSYDYLGQVIGGHRKWANGDAVLGQQFDYAYDDIGNRKYTKSGRSVPNSPSASVFTNIYTANRLNQYTLRTVASNVDITGSAAADATVEVNDLAATRQGEYFFGQLIVTNVGEPVFQPVNVVGWKAGANGNDDGIMKTTGHVFVEETPEAFTYDADGNMTSDGRWEYSWDAENRLTQMVARTSAVNAGAPDQKLVFVYDHTGRRISKEIYNHLSGAWELAESRKFIYDGWNLIREISASPGLPVSASSYLWGLDLSGTIQGAGGVGGLLAGLGPDLGAGFFAAYDANGNICSLVDALGNAPASTCEYGPFGELMRNNTVDSAAPPFRVSTKYMDIESSLYSYTFRYHDIKTARWISRDPVSELDGAQLYTITRNDAVNRVDYLGLATLEHCCPCVDDLSSCSLQIDMSASASTLAGPGDYDKNIPPYKYFFGLKVKVTIVHSGGKSVSRCHLHQAVESWYAPEGGKRVVDPDDYPNNDPRYRDMYGGWWLKDEPGAGESFFKYPGSTPLPNWFQAHVYIEEAPNVQSWYGFAGTVKFMENRIEARTRFEQWMHEKRAPYSLVVF